MNLRTAVVVRVARPIHRGVGRCIAAVGVGHALVVGLEQVVHAVAADGQVSQGAGPQEIERGHQLVAKSGGVAVAFLARRQIVELDAAAFDDEVQREGIVVAKARDGDRQVVKILPCVAQADADRVVGTAPAPVSDAQLPVALCPETDPPGAVGFGP
ncbi:MAG: hypothetical protein JRF33_24850, partial [Deltaproteobacteria bacterium]|nr:hypothetical protein [Deltaproteobacteria bacterium]